MKIAFVDLDGTLLDSTRRHQSVLEYSLNSLAVFHESLDDFVCFKSKGYTTKDYLLNRLGLENSIADIVVSKWVEHIEDNNFLKLDILYADAITFLEALSNMGFYVVIVTARRNKQYLEFYMKRNDISDYVNDIIVVSPKDATNNKIREIQKINYDDRSVLIGDTEIDFKASKILGITGYMLNRGFRNKQFWDELGISSYGTLDEITDDIKGEGRTIQCKL